MGTGWRSLLDEWADLAAGDPTATPFSSAAWARAWWEHWSEGAAPWVLAVRDGGALIGVMPFFLRRRGPTRVLAGLGTIVGNYWDLVAAPAQRADATAQCMAALREHDDEWDAIVLDRLPPDSPTIAALENSGLRIRARESTPAPRLDLPGSFDEYLKERSQNRRKQIRKYLRPIENGTLALHAVSEPDGIARAVARWQELRVASWAQRGKDMNPEHASERFGAFLVDLLGTLVPAGVAQLWELREGDEVVGVSIELVDAHTHYHWLVSFDADRGDLRPGHVVAAAHIRSAIEAGRRWFDFMVGDEPYKYRWGAVDRELPWLVITSTRARSRAAELGSRLLDFSRRPGSDPASAPPS